MRTILRVLLYDVLLGLVYIACDTYLAYWYFSHGHNYWAALTLGAMALPGTLGGGQISTSLGSYRDIFRAPGLHLLLSQRTPGGHQATAI